MGGELFEPNENNRHRFNAVEPELEKFSGAPLGTWSNSSAVEYLNTCRFNLTDSADPGNVAEKEALKPANTGAQVDDEISALLKQGRMEIQERCPKNWARIWNSRIDLESWQRPSLFIKSITNAEEVGQSDLVNEIMETTNSNLWLDGSLFRIRRVTPESGHPAERHFEVYNKNTGEVEQSINFSILQEKEAREAKTREQLERERIAKLEEERVRKQTEDRQQQQQLGKTLSKYSRV
jgi:hypothetical protein